MPLPPSALASLVKWLGNLIFKHQNLHPTKNFQPINVLIYIVKLGLKLESLIFFLLIILVFPVFWQKKHEFSKNSFNKLWSFDLGPAFIKASTYMCLIWVIFKWTKMNHYRNCWTKMNDSAGHRHTRLYVVVNWLWQRQEIGL